MRVERPESRALRPDGDSTPAQPNDLCLEFVRFCYRRRRVAWPELYDEMCAVAARGAFRGLSYADLPEHGINFSLTDLPRLAALTQRVQLEEHAMPEAGRVEGGAIRLAAAQAST